MTHPTLDEQRRLAAMREAIERRVRDLGERSGWSDPAKEEEWTGLTHGDKLARYQRVLDGLRRDAP